MCFTEFSSNLHVWSTRNELNLNFDFFSRESCSKLGAQTKSIDEWERKNRYSLPKIFQHWKTPHGVRESEERATRVKDAWERILKFYVPFKSLMQKVEIYTKFLLSKIFIGLQNINKLSE